MYESAMYGNYKGYGQNLNHQYFKINNKKYITKHFNFNIKT